MERSKQARVWGSLVICAGLGAARAAGQDEPPLLPPELTAPALEPAPPAEIPKTAESTKPVAPAPPTAPAPSRPLLIIPGVTAPRSTRRSAPNPSPVLVPPALESPAMPGSPTPVRGRIVSTPEPSGGSTGRTSKYNVPLSLEPIPEGAENLAPIADPNPGSRGRRGSAASRAPLSTMTEPPRQSDSTKPAPESAGPRRNTTMGGLFGRFFEQGRTEPARSTPRNEIKVERRSDPAADTALRRRIENQIREQLGDKVSSAEVRVVGRNILIRARAARFWQKRSVRRSLESLPAISGRQAHVELD